MASDPIGFKDRDETDEDGTQTECWTDKRLLLFESEFAGLLRKMDQRGNTLSPVIRTAWDSGNLHVVTKHSPAHATDAHISIVTHITGDELGSTLRSNEAVNGFATRFLWCLVTRSKRLPRGGALTDADYDHFADLLSGRLAVAQQTGRVEMDGEAWRLFEEHYDDLTEGGTGLFGKIVARGAPQVRRLALIYTLADGCGEIAGCRMKAALAVWRYCRDSAEFIFQAFRASNDADRILATLGREGALSRTDINSKVFEHNRPAKDIKAALDQLVARGIVTRDLQNTGGRTREVWSVRSE